MAMYVIRVERKKAVARLIDLATQPMLDPFSNHCSLLARDGMHVGVDVWRQLFSERHIQILARPFRALRYTVPELEVIDTQRVRELSRCLDQRALCFGVKRRR